MPKLKRIVKYPSDEIHGEGSWVKVTRLTIAGMKQVAIDAATILIKQEQAAARLRLVREGKLDPSELVIPEVCEELEALSYILKGNVIDWNWTDDDGNPLPNPRENPEIIETLVGEETNFLSALIRGSEAKVKN